jgi:hypothetical protein
VTRATSLTVKGRDRNGKEVRIKAEGWLARIFQHEVDHLEGVLFLDRVHDREKIHWVEPEPEGAERDRGADGRAQRDGGAEPGSRSSGQKQATAVAPAGRAKEAEL